MRYDAQTEIEVPISMVEPENGVNAGIYYKSIAPGVVPTHEEHEARLERGLRLYDWQAMETFEKALLIANRRNRIAQGNLQADAEIRAAKQKGKKGKR